MSRGPSHQVIVVIHSHASQRSQNGHHKLLSLLLRTSDAEIFRPEFELNRNGTDTTFVGYILTLVCAAFV